MWKTIRFKIVPHRFTAALPALHPSGCDSWARNHTRSRMQNSLAATSLALIIPRIMLERMPE